MLAPEGGLVRGTLDAPAQLRGAVTWRERFARAVGKTLSAARLAVA